MPELSENHAPCCSCHGASGSEVHSGLVSSQISESKGGEQHVTVGGEGVSGRRQDARIDFLVYKSIPHFIRSYFQHCWVSS